MLLVPLIQYLLCLIFRVLDYKTQLNSYCSIYFFKSWYDWFQEISMIMTGIIIQVFMLRNMKVAAVLRAKSIQEESETRIRVRHFTYFYLPLYGVLSVLIYVMEILIFSKKDITGVSEWFLIGFYSLMNVAKLSFSAFVGLTTLRFATSINELIQLVTYEFGETFN